MRTALILPLFFSLLPIHPPTVAAGERVTEYAYNGTGIVTRTAPGGAEATYWKSNTINRGCNSRRYPAQVQGRESLLRQTGRNGRQSGGNRGGSVV